MLTQIEREAVIKYRRGIWGFVQTKAVFTDENLKWFLKKYTNQTKIKVSTDLPITNKKVKKNGKV